MTAPLGIRSLPSTLSFTPDMKRTKRDQTLPNAWATSPEGQKRVEDIAATATMKKVMTMMGGKMMADMAIKYPFLARE